jgi:hypothetical protein
MGLIEMVHRCVDSREKFLVEKRNVIHCRREGAWVMVDCVFGHFKLEEDFETFAGRVGLVPVFALVGERIVDYLINRDHVAWIQAVPGGHRLQMQDGLTLHVLNDISCLLKLFE